MLTKSWQFVTISVFTILGACSAPLRTEVVEPPRAAAAAQLRRVAVLPFEGQDASRTTAEVESLIAEATDHGSPFYTVVDRRTLQGAVNELKLQRTGLVDPRTVSRIGKLVGADGIYTGTVFVPPVARTIHTEQRYGCASFAQPGKFFSKCSSPTKTTVSCTEKIAQFTVVPRLIAISTARVVYQPTITGQVQNSSCSDFDGEVNDNVLLGQALSQVMEKLRIDVTPHIRKLDIVLKTDTSGLDASSRVRFDNALAFAHADRLDRTCATWRNLLAEYPTNEPLNFDVAVCDESEGQLEAALRRVSDLDSSLQRPDADVNVLRTRLQTEIRSRQAFQQPMSTPGNGPIIRSGSGRLVTDNTQ